MPNAPFITVSQKIEDEKKRENSQDRIKINWQEKNPLTCVDMFEYSSVTDVEEIKRFAK